MIYSPSEFLWTFRVVEWRWKIYALRKDMKWLSVVLGIQLREKKPQKLPSSFFFCEGSIFQNHYTKWEPVKLNLPLSFPSVWNLGQKKGKWKSLLFGVEPRWEMLLTSLLAANCVNYDWEWAPEDILHFSVLSACVLSEQAEVLQGHAAKFVSDKMTFCRQKKGCWNMNFLKMYAYT